MKRIVAVVMALFALCSACACAQDNVSAESWLDSVLQNRASGGDSRYVAVLSVTGEISEYSYDYDHLGTIRAVDALIDDPQNAALFLELNTPGGNIYEADELYHTIQVYKELTGRPVIAYMEQECCSAGVLVAMAADKIMASRMTVTGCVGVYMTSYSEAGLYDMLGIEQEYVATGENKVSGYPQLTQGQRDILQALVDESFGFFLDAIGESRGMTREQMQPFADGRMLSALQAQEMGLVDEVCYYDEALALMDEAYGLSDAELLDITPEMDDSYAGLSDLYDGFDLFDFLPGFQMNRRDSDGQAARASRALKGI